MSNGWGCPVTGGPGVTGRDDAAASMAGDERADLRIRGAGPALRIGGFSFSLPRAVRPWMQLVDVLTAYHTETRQDGLRIRIRQAAEEAAGNPARWWTPTTDELVWAARAAWREETRCIGRARWSTALVRDSRALTDPAAVAADLAVHLRTATNGGRIRSVITLLHPGVRVANEQLIGYAGHRRRDGTILGDPRNAGITDHALAAGWRRHRPAPDRGRHTAASHPRAARRTAWDVLPLVIHGPDGQPSVHELPAGDVRQVRLRHPTHPWFGALGLRWYAVPALANHRLELTDTVSYPVVISGFYLSTEIACRDLADSDRYNVLPALAERLGLDTSRRRTLWEGAAEHVLHEAVLTSFDQAGVSLADPATETDLYLAWVDREARRGRPVRADWSWIQPPWHPARTATYHHYQLPPDPDVRPRYHRRTPP